MPYYRGLGLSMVEGVDLDVDGDPVARRSHVVHRPRQHLPHDRAPVRVLDDRWEMGEPARIDFAVDAAAGARRPRRQRGGAAAHLLHAGARRRSRHQDPRARLTCLSRSAARSSRSRTSGWPRPVRSRSCCSMSPRTGWVLTWRSTDSRRSGACRCRRRRGGELPPHVLDPRPASNGLWGLRRPRSQAGPVARRRRERGRAGATARGGQPPRVHHGARGTGCRPRRRRSSPPALDSLGLVLTLEVQGITDSRRASTGRPACLAAGAQGCP